MCFTSRQQLIQCPFTSCINISDIVIELKIGENQLKTGILSKEKQGESEQEGTNRLWH